MPRSSAVAELRSQSDLAVGEHAAPPPDLSPVGVARDRLGEDHRARCLDDRSLRMQLAAGDGTDEQQVERGGEEEELLFDGVRGEERRVVEDLEIRDTVRRARGMKKVVADWNDDSATAVADG